jgi:hypothetical protein
VVGLTLTVQLRQLNDGLLVLGFHFLLILNQVKLGIEVRLQFLRQFLSLNLDLLAVV